VYLFTNSEGNIILESVKIPESTIERLAIYLRKIEELYDKGYSIISSEKLANVCKVNPAQIRKDLSYFGEFGVRGVGYEISELMREIKRILDTGRVWRLALVGVGNIGSAILRHKNFYKRGYNFIAAFDIDPQKIGREVIQGIKVQPMEELEDTVKRLNIEIGVITTPSTSAREVCRALVNAGIKAILNFSPIFLRSRKGCIVENMDFTIKLDNLAYHLCQLEGKNFSK